MVIKTNRQYKQHVKSRKTMKGGAYQPFKTNQEIFSEIIKAAGSLSRTKLVEKIISYLKSGGEKGTKFLFFRFNSIRKGQKWFKLYGGIKSLLEKLNEYFYGDNTISNIPDKILSAKRSLIEFIAKKNKVAGRFSSIKYTFKHETQVLLLLFLFLSSKPVPLLPDQYLQVVMKNLESSINKESTDNQRLQSAINAITTYLKYTNFVDKTENIKLDFITIAFKIIDTINKLVITSINQIAAAESNAKQTLTNLSKTLDKRLERSNNINKLRQDVSNAEQSILNKQKENRNVELTRKLEQADAIRNKIQAELDAVKAERARKREEKLTKKQNREAEQIEINKRRENENKSLGLPEERSILSRIFGRRNSRESVVPAPAASLEAITVVPAPTPASRPTPAQRPTPAPRPIHAPRSAISQLQASAPITEPILGLQAVQAVQATAPRPTPAAPAATSTANPAATAQTNFPAAEEAARQAEDEEAAKKAAEEEAAKKAAEEEAARQAEEEAAKKAAAPASVDSNASPPFAPPALPSYGGFIKLKHRKTHKHISSKKNIRNKKNNNRMSRKHKLSKRKKKSKNSK